MTEYFIMTNSFAAPFFSDTNSCYREAETPEQALEQEAAEYSHPSGLFSAVAYSSADARNKGEKPLARWLCNHAQAEQEITKDLKGYSYLGHAPGKFEINGELHEVPDPKGGSIV